jgi:integrase/recombinase XerD
MNDHQMIGPVIQSYFMEHLIRHKSLSDRTIKSYRDTFKLFLLYLQDKLNKAPALVEVSNVNAKLVLDFLEDLEGKRSNSARSRNARLSAIRSFFKWVSISEPQFGGICTQILAIPQKRTDTKLIQSLSKKEMDAIINAPQRKDRLGYRDHALLLTMYNTGARVSEIIELKKASFNFGEPSFVHISGKGRKDRTIPLWSNTTKTLKAWFKQTDESQTIAFPNRQGGKLSRNGVDYILQKAATIAKEKVQSLVMCKVSPHVIRHTTAMHLLQSGVDISVIALYLGHESIETTHVYVEADLKMKEKALQKLRPTNSPVARYKPNDATLRFLSTL